MQIQFTRTGSNTLVGNFESGDRARVSDALGKHLIDFGVAKSLETQVETAPQTLTLKRKRKQ